MAQATRHHDRVRVHRRSLRLDRSSKRQHRGQRRRTKHRGLEAAPSASTAAVNACGDAPVALSIWGGYPELDAVFKKAGEAFKAPHPNVDLSVFSTDLRGFEQKLHDRPAGETAGDIIVRTTNFLSRFIDQDLLAADPGGPADIRQERRVRPAAV